MLIVDVNTMKECCLVAQGRRLFREGGLGFECVKRDGMIDVVWCILGPSNALRKVNVL